MVGDGTWVGRAWTCTVWSSNHGRPALLHEVLPWNLGNGAEETGLASISIIRAPESEVLGKFHRQKEARSCGCTSRDI
jgi:hypothetical protein